MLYLIRWFYNCFRTKYRLRKYPSVGAPMHKHCSLYGGRGNRGAEQWRSPVRMLLGSALQHVDSEYVLRASNRWDQVRFRPPHT